MVAPTLLWLRERVQDEGVIGYAFFNNFTVIDRLGEKMIFVKN